MCHGKSLVKHRGGSNLMAEVTFAAEVKRQIWPLSSTGTRLALLLSLLPYKVFLVLGLWTMDDFM